MNDCKYYKVTCLPYVENIKNVWYEAIFDWEDASIDEEALIDYFFYILDVFKEKKLGFSRDKFVRMVKEFTYRVEEVSKEEAEKDTCFYFEGDD